MIHAAIWLICATIVVTFVICFAIMGLGLIAWLFTEPEGQFVLACIVGLLIWGWVSIDNQNKKSEEAYQKQQATNKPLQEQCISAANNLYNSGVANLRAQGRYTQAVANNVYYAYQNELTNCKIKYPAL